MRPKSQLRDLQSGVVSLLEMLRMGAAALYLIGQQLEEYSLVPQVVGSKNKRHEFELFLRCLKGHCEDMGLALSDNQIGVVVEALNSGQSWVRVRSHFVQLQSRVFEELQAQTLFYVAANKTAFLSPTWLSKSPIQLNFPSALKEIRKAGKCYAYEENDACAFHSMRALEIGLNSLATKLEVDFEHTNWNTVIERIQSVIDKQKKRDKRLRNLGQEKFYSSAAVQFMYLKDGWRNYVMHVYETYGESEAREILRHSCDFLNMLAGKLSEPGHPFTVPSA